MSIKSYLQKKYGFNPCRETPIEFLYHELLLGSRPNTQVKNEIRTLLDVKKIPNFIRFDTFCDAVDAYLSNTLAADLQHQ